MSAYAIDWGEHFSEVRFAGKLNVAMLNEANVALHRDASIATQIGTLWDLSHAYVEDNLELNFAIALDIASSFIVPDKLVAFVACSNDMEALCQRYIEACQQIGSSWRCRIFSRRPEAEQWLSDAIEAKAKLTT